MLAPSHECIHTSCYCEENVWHLCHNVKENHPSKLQGCYAVFISNGGQTIPLWYQKSAGEAGFVIWDYHVIFLHKNAYECQVYDLDSTLSFPCQFEDYLEQAIKCDEMLPTQFHRLFRIIPAEDFLNDFASDRKHMQKADGSWMKPPPPYPPIKSKTCSNNLNFYINMSCNISKTEVVNFSQFSERFQDGDSNVYDNVTVLCNGRHVLTFLRGSLHIYDMDSSSSVKNTPRKTIHFHNKIVFRFFFDEQYLVCVYQRIGARGCQVDIRSASNFQPLSREFDPAEGGREELSGLFDYCNGWIAAQSADQRTVHLWNIDTGHHQVIRHAGDIIYSFKCNFNNQILTKSLDACRLWQETLDSSQMK
uniref:Protein N-terminal glutamine amidohydrolase n=1 Tax=Evadne anonyx TaxID=141404 RepID=A0A9N6WQE8_9CRUS|nr:EOG090X0C0Q [Evadne anonyx]